MRSFQGIAFIWAKTYREIDFQICISVPFTVSIVFSVYGSITLKTRIARNVKISVFIICVEVIILLLLYNLHDYTL